MRTVALPRARRTARPDGPLSVLFVEPDLAVGGAERHVATLLPALDRDRFRASVVCIGAQGALFGSVVAAGLGARALHRRRRAAPAAVRDLVRLMRAERPDVVLVRGYSAEVLGRVAALLSGVPVVLVWVHDSGDIARRSHLRRVADRLLNPRTTAVIGPAMAQRGHLVDGLGYRPGQVRILPHGTDLDAVASCPDRRGAAVAIGLDPDDPLIGIVAGLRPEKDHRTLLDAFARVRAAHPRARLVVAGDGPLRAGLEHRASTLGVADRVHFLGERTDVPAVLAALHVVVLASTTECFPMALLEAMAAGRPVVATAVGGVPEIVDDGVTGHLVPPSDPDAMAGRLTAVLDDPAAAAAAGRAGRERAERLFGLDAAVRRVEELLEREAR